MSDDGESKVSQLTIATSSDGKLHFVKSENGKKEEGLWTGPLPKTPDMEKELASLKSVDINNPELSDLSKEIDSSVQDYIKKALASLK